MFKVAEKFKHLAKQGRKAFIPFMTFGYPDIKTSIDIFFTLIDAGADMIEIGVPFSDPIADGPLIQSASTIALKQGVTLGKVLDFLKRENKNIKIPVLFMSYYNPIYAMGEEKFFAKASSCGLSGVIVPDLLAEEAAGFVNTAHKHKIDTVFFISPTTSLKRFNLISRLSSGFIYYISVKGITGERKKFPPEVINNISLAKSRTNRPLCVGFGISTPQQARCFKKVSDGIIVGSVITHKIALWHKDKNFLAKLKKFVQWLKS